VGLLTIIVVHVGHCLVAVCSAADVPSIALTVLNIALNLFYSYTDVQWKTGAF